MTFTNEQLETLLDGLIKGYSDPSEPNKLEVFMGVKPIAENPTTNAWHVELYFCGEMIYRVLSIISAEDNDIERKKNLSLWRLIIYLMVDGVKYKTESIREAL